MFKKDWVEAPEVDTEKHPLSHRFRAQKALYACGFDMLTTAVGLAIVDELRKEDDCVWPGMRAIVRKAKVSLGTASNKAKILIEVGAFTVGPSHGVGRLRSDRKRPRTSGFNRQSHEIIVEQLKKAYPNGWNLYAVEHTAPGKLMARKRSGWKGAPSRTLIVDVDRLEALARIAEVMIEESGLEPWEWDWTPARIKVFTTVARSKQELLRADPDCSRGDDPRSPDANPRSRDEGALFTQDEHKVLGVGLEVKVRMKVPVAERPDSSPTPSPFGQRHDLFDQIEALERERRKIINDGIDGRIPPAQEAEAMARIKEIPKLIVAIREELGRKEVA
jgi:hypothetical protein